MKQLTKYFHVLACCVLLLITSCSSNSQDKESENLVNDSIINAQIKSLTDSMLAPIHFHFDVFSIADSSNGNDSIKIVRGTGVSRKYSNLYSKVKLDVAGSYKVSNGTLSCTSLKVICPDVGSVFAIFEKYDTLLTYAMDSLTFFEKYYGDVGSQYDSWKDRIYKSEYAYNNRTKVHFGISKDEYNRLGEEFQRNFYEGLIGEGAFELAKPIFSSNNKFVGFEIMELHDKTFSYGNVLSNAEMTKKRQLGYDAHECFEFVYECELYNMEIISRYDKFERKTKHSLKAYWNEYSKVYR